jgi:hypothetical protein
LWAGVLGWVLRHPAGVSKVDSRDLISRGFLISHQERSSFLIPRDKEKISNLKPEDLVYLVFI